ncbi:MAG TPA: rhodanese-like domain-containing protein [Bacteroidales bacterium]|nr:rhodanese-like domain-containing protein [Bacteroidales bacterium]
MSEDFERLGIKIDRIRHFLPAEAFEASKSGAIFVDVRQDYKSDFKAFDVEKIIYVNHTEIEKRYQELPKNEFLIIANSVGLHSKEVVEFLLNKGYTRLANLNGGIYDWERDGLPMAIDVSERLTRSCACMLKPRERKNKE